MALVKRDELLEHPQTNEGNQQPSCISNDEVVSDTEGSTTNPEAKAVMGTRASRQDNVLKEKFLEGSYYLKKLL